MFKSILIAAAVLCSIGALAQPYSLSGRVQHAKTHQALAGATVELKETKQVAITDEFGNFLFSKLPAGAYTVAVRYIGFDESTQSLSVPEKNDVNFLLEESWQLTDEVVVLATRADSKTPTTYTQVNKQAIQKQNFGQDLPMLLNWTPSMVTTSDAGAGIGYTGIRIRGSDATRINVTINGIALNDAESQGVYWVNTPDLASSVQSVQIQRGVGTSTNGAGAFGATVSVQTDALNRDPYAEATASAGSFNSRRITFKTGTGLIKNGWAFDGRISDVRSDGFLERASSKLNSYYLSGGYYGDKTIVKAIMFGGHEQTYQAWYGVDALTMKLNRRFNYAGAIYDQDGNISRYYDNEVDDYKQDHYQLHLSHQLSQNWNANVSFHYTYGRGFYEQYKQGESFADLGLPNVTIGDELIETTDAIVLRKLDNHYYGATYSLNYSAEKTEFTFGGAVSRYGNARHFGEIQWAEIAVAAPIRHVYYDGDSEKNDYNFYAKWNYDITDRLNSYVDVQYRGVNYNTAGIDDGQVPYDVKDEFHFLNPKAGLTYAFAENSSLYASYAIVNREPNRSDYLDGADKPKSERLGNLEVGWKRTSGRFGFEANYYLMNYTDQLVLTGAVNDTGYPIRANIGKSYRTGIELSGSINVTSKLNWNANVTWSENKNKGFAVVDENSAVTKRNTTIILSPSWIAGSQLTWLVFHNFQASLLSKYVGKQFLDNTQNDNVKLDGYFVNDIRLSYRLQPKGVNAIDIGFLINNVFDTEYESNGYGYDGAPYYFPQAGTNFLAMISVKI